MADSKKKNGQNANGIKVLIIGLVLICLVAGYYYYLSNKRQKAMEETPAKATAVEEALAYNFERNYPPTPKEVVKLYCQMTQCFYNEEYTEEEFVQLALQIRNLYDDELIAAKTENQYIEDLRWDVNQLRNQEIVISSYATSASTDVEEYTKGGFKWAKLYCSFTLRKGTYVDSTNEVFLLRKDDAGHWKIYGFKLADDEETRAYQ